MAEIQNETNATILSGSQSSDEIRNAGANVLINAYGGNDEIDNYNENVTINAGAGADSIKNTDSGISLFDDHYVNTNGKYVLINADEGDDHIENYGANSTINGGAGKDSIENFRSNVVINGDADNDYISNKYGNKVIINGGSGEDYIFNEGNDSTVSGGIGNDTIEGNGTEVILYGNGDGNDLITNYQNKNSVKLTSGTISSTLTNGSDIVLTIGTGKLTLSGAKNKSVIINNVDGTQTIINSDRLGTEIDNYHSNETLNGGMGDDSIYNSGSNVLINAKEGSDTINNDGSNVTINAGADADSIYSDYYEDHVTINGDDGNDTIKNYSSNSSINGGVGNDHIEIGYNTTAHSTSNVTVSCGDGDDYVYVAYGAQNAVIYSGNGNNEIIVSGENAEINLGSGDNEVYSGKNSIVNIGSGKVTISGSAGDNATVNGTDNNDQIWLGAYYYGSSGNGGLNIKDTEAIVRAGKGNDTIYGGTGKNIFEYAQGDGNDVIRRFGGEDILNITSGNIDSTQISGNDVIFKIGNGSVTLKNMKNHYLTVQDSNGNTTTKLYGSDEYLPIDVIKKFVSSISNTKLNSTTDALDEAVKACSHFTSYQDVLDHLLSDCKNAADGETFLEDYCGITSANSDNGAITGWETGGKEVKTLDKLLTNITGTSYPSGTSFTVNGLTINIPEKNTLSETEQSIIQKIYNGWAENSLNLIDESYKLSFNNGDTSFKEINVIFYKSVGEITAAYVSGNNLYINVGNVGNHPDDLMEHEFTHVVQNANFNVQLPKFLLEGMADFTADNGGSEDIAGDYSKLAEYFNGNNDDTGMYAAGYIFWRYLAKQASDNYNASNTKDDGTNDNEDDAKDDDKDNISIVSGTSSDDTFSIVDADITVKAGAGNDTIRIYGKNTVIDGESGNDYILISSLSGGIKINGGSGSDSIENWASSLSIDGGADNDTIWSWNASSSNITMIGDTGDDRLELWGSNSIIDGGEGNDLIFTHAKNTTVNSGNGNDTVENWDDSSGWSNGSLVGGAGKNKISTGAGNDYIMNYGQYTTINAGAGNDTINLVIGYKYDYSKNNYIDYSFGDGNDVIYGCSSTDTLNITGGNYTSLISGQDVIISVGDGSMTLKNAANVSLNIQGAYATTPTVPTADTTPSGQDTVAPVTIPATDTTPADTTPSGQDTVAPVTIPTDTTPTIVTALNLTNVDKSPVTIDSAIKTVDASARTKTTKILGNSLANTIQGGTKSDSIRGGAGNDSILGNAGNDKLFGEIGNDTLVGGKGNDTLTGGNGSDVFVYSSGDGKDVIADYTSNQDKIRILSGSVKKVSLSGADVVLKVGSGSIKVKKAKDKALTIVNANGVSSVATFTDTMTITNSSKASIKVTDSLIKTIDASKRTKAINITGNSNANTITGSKSNDTLTGGSGKDTFIYTGGNDIITDYAANQDKLKISTGTLKNANISGNDVVLKVNSNSIKVKGAKNKAISITDSKKNNFALLIGSTAADKLNGTSAADSILGGAGNDTLTGNKGNDTLTGGAGRDVFVYKLGDGNDTITDYTAGQDTIQLTGSYTQSTVGNNVVLKVGNGSITLRNAKGKKLTITTPTTTSKNFIEEHWFTEDNNFTSTDVDSVLDKKSNSIAVDYKFNDVTAPNKDDQFNLIAYTKTNKK